MKTVIELTKNDILIKKEENGIHTVKYTTPDSLKAALSVGDFNETPLMPASDGVIKYMSKGNKELFMYVSAPSRIEARYENEGEMEDYTIQTPHLLWTLLFHKEDNDNRRLTWSSLNALKSGVRTSTDRVYQAPLPNIFYYNQGSPICWGSYSPVFTGTESIPSIMSQFFLAPFNADLNPNLHPDEDSYELEGYEEEVYATTDLFEYMDTMISNESYKGEFEFPQEVISIDRGTISDLIDFNRRQIHNY